MTKFCV